jgi:Cu2+-containing amine oxidase
MRAVQLVRTVLMPTIWHSFKLRPHSFFNRNPVIDLRKDAEDRE